MEPHAFGNLGGQEKPVDKNDIVLGASLMPTYTHPKELKNAAAWGAPVEYQGDQPACGAHSGSKAAGIYRGKRFSARATWADLKSFDGWAINDGTDIRSIFKSITKNLGAVEFDLYGNDASLPLQEYAKALTAQLRAAGVKYTGDGYGFAGSDRSFDALKQFISDHGPTIILMRVNARFWTAANGKTSWKEADILPLATPTPQFPNSSGHFVVCHSFDDKYIYFINSFGETWGRNGHGYFEASYMPQVNDWGALFGLAFKKDLYYGMTDVDVLALQKFLNTHGAPVATTGDGSPGHETTYFGSLTKNAVMRYQFAHNIAPAAGYFGALTRAYVQTHP